MKKCPYCGWETDKDVCEHCKAAIRPEKPKGESPKGKTKDKELK